MGVGGAEVVCLNFPNLSFFFLNLPLSSSPLSNLSCFSFSCIFFLYFFLVFFVFGQVSWVRQSDLHILTSGLLAYTSDSRFRAHHTSNDWILEIRDLKWTDAGSFSFFFCLFPSSFLLLSDFLFSILQFNKKPSFFSHRNS